MGYGSNLTYTPKTYLRFTSENGKNSEMIEIGEGDCDISMKWD